MCTFVCLVRFFLDLYLHFVVTNNALTDVDSRFSETRQILSFSGIRLVRIGLCKKNNFLISAGSHGKMKN